MKAVMHSDKREIMPMNNFHNALFRVVI